MQNKFNSDSHLMQSICLFKERATNFFDECDARGISIKHEATLSKIKFWIGEEIVARIGGAK